MCFEYDPGTKGVVAPTAYHSKPDSSNELGRRNEHSFEQEQPFSKRLPLVGRLPAQVRNQLLHSRYGRSYNSLL